MDSFEKKTDEIGLRIQKEFQSFLTEFSGIEDIDSELTSSQTKATKIYVEQIKGWASARHEEKNTLFVDFNHLSHYRRVLADGIQLAYYRLEPYLVHALRNVVFMYIPSLAEKENRIYHIAFYNYNYISSIRELKTHKVGQLMAISGTVTRSSEVRPELLYGTFSCVDCGAKSPKLPQQFKYTEPVSCMNTMCHNRTKWKLEIEDSIFCNWQVLRVQENSSEIPAGSMPRTIRVILRNEVVESVKPGDKCQFVGMLIVVPDIAQLSRATSLISVDRSEDARKGNNEGVEGLKALGVRDLTYRLCFLASSARSLSNPRSGWNEGVFTREEEENESINNAMDGDAISEIAKRYQKEFTPEELITISKMRKHPRLYSSLSKSIAPNVHGHEEIKRGLLLMLLGGVHKVTPDKQNLRGDINVCIIGDPSTSKSQFLKYVCNLMPRAVYTSGKASSAAGLTASVTRDSETGDFAIEAGALMLADNGICCIDEFDKMDPKDQTAIHEAMEQQTISISKAGIQATLNARTSILAAANPIKGRYDRTATLKQNIDMSAPIMSRFDLFFVVLDDGDEISDCNVAKHIINIHQNENPNPPEWSSADICAYIRYAKKLKPQLTPESKKCLMEHYVSLRSKDTAGGRTMSYRITVRQLESMIRLAEARARLDLSPIIREKDVNEAARLLDKSILFVDQKDVTLDEQDNEEEKRERERAEKEMEKENHRVIQGKETDEEEETRSKSKGHRKIGDKDKDEEKAQSHKLEIKFDEYKRICHLIVAFLRKCEQQNRNVSQGELLNWFVTEQEKEGEIAKREDIEKSVKLVRAVIRRLIEVDHILLTDDTYEEDDENERILQVHPNYDIDNEAQTHVRKPVHPSVPPSTSSSQRPKRSESSSAKGVSEKGTISKTSGSSGSSGSSSSTSSGASGRLSRKQLREQTQI